MTEIRRSWSGRPSVSVTAMGLRVAAARECRLHPTEEGSWTTIASRAASRKAPARSRGDEELEERGQGARSAGATPRTRPATRGTIRKDAAGDAKDAVDGDDKCSDRATERDENGEELIDEEGRNPTQRRLDEESETAATPASAPWGSGENESD